MKLLDDFSPYDDNFSSQKQVVEEESYKSKDINYLYFTLSMLLGSFIAYLSEFKPDQFLLVCPPAIIIMYLLGKIFKIM
jgi:hypothetical protein